MMLKNNISFFTWLALLFFLSVSCTNSEQKKSQIAKKGVMDLRHFSGDLDIYLNGEWEFYWNQLLTPVEIRQQKPKPAFLNLPSYWNNQLINDKKISGNGYATFRLRILLDSTNQDNNGLEIKEILTSYKCWVNNNFLCENGVVSTTDQNAVPYFKPIIKTIDNKSDTIEIVIQVSNFSHKYGGFFLTPKLSSIERLYSEHNKELAYDLFLFGAIFIMALYHLGLYLINKKRISALYFSIFAFLISLRTILTGTEFLVSVIPDLTWNLTYRLEYLTLFISPYFYLAFLYHNFKDDFKRIYLKISLLICLSFAVLILFEAKIFTAVVDIYQLIILVFVFYGIFVLVKASGKKREGSYIIMISQFVLVIAVINDLLYNQGILTYMELTPLGLIIFILGQSLLLALKFNAAFVKNEELTAELNFRNENLEKMVRERTAEIYQQKEEIQTQAEKLISTNSILQEYLLELEKLSIVASKTDNAVIIMDGSGNFLWINSAFTRLYGYNIDDMVHVHKNILHSSSNPEIKNIIETCIQTKQSITYESNTPSASGEIIYTQTTITPILNENGEIEKLIAIDSDIRKLKKAEAVIRNKNEQITSSLRYALTIQNAILPFSGTIQNYFDHFIIFMPKDIVSGDFYWFNSILSKDKADSDFLIHYFAVVDCTGHGVPGAFMSMIGSRLLSEIVNERHIYETGEIVSELDKMVYKALKQDQSDNNDGMDLSLIRIERTENAANLHFTGAKSNGYYINCKTGTIEKMEADRRNVGGKSSASNTIQFTTQNYILEKGDTIYLFTDGITDQNNPERKRFGIVQLKNLLLSVRCKPIIEQKSIIEISLKNWMQNEDQRDDITIAGIRI